MKKETYTAVVLAAGKGSRMQSKVKKQFMKLLGKPLVYYALLEFQESPVDEIILVTGRESIDYCRKQIVEKYGFTKVKEIVAGGKERYESVYEALKVASMDYVLIHDGARAFLDEEIISRSMKGVAEYKACVIGMPVKDTIKIVDKDQYAIETPKRSLIWQIQTPQCFITDEIRQAYEKMMAEEAKNITDDAMVMEQFGDRRVKLIEGSYENIKITTPEDIVIGKALLKMRRVKRKTFQWLRTLHH
ncbi:MAG: 2-C-methyl-D-erythritol 4-phosphate cytidylyltransferase [Lachnospiraceae bacterium]|nr:2-C-methyl-D-erythritol 4-phosphate cytidylyltransferase [Lachnospiraceae bacterium]